MLLDYEALDALITRLEAATEGSAELDRAIYALVPTTPSFEERLADFRRELGRDPLPATVTSLRESEAYELEYPSQYTCSVDAALSLVPTDWALRPERGLFQVRGSSNDPRTWKWACHLSHATGDEAVWTDPAPTAALAVTIAALMARSPW